MLPSSLVTGRPAALPAADDTLLPHRDRRGRRRAVPARVPANDGSWTEDGCDDGEPTDAALYGARRGAVLGRGQRSLAPRRPAARRAGLRRRLGLDRPARLRWRR